MQHVYKECWGPILGFRHVGQHATCTTCARLGKTRRYSPGMAERQHADNEYTAHVKGVFAMRRGGVRFARLIVAPCEPGCTLTS